MLVENTDAASLICLLALGVKQYSAGIYGFDCHKTSRSFDLFTSMVCINLLYI